jgi:putative addiction module component (TIGR02574 family)
MPSELREIETRALRLPANERERLASQLFRSLSDDKIDAAWEAEIATRIEKLDNGSAQFRPIDEVFAEIDKRTA